MKRKLMMFLSLFFLGIGIITAQTQVRGTVVDDSGEPVIGATIQIKGTSQGTVTDYDGKFTLLAPAEGTLVVSFVGFITQEVAVSSTLRVVLLTDTQLLDEVMVVAYGTAKKESFTGSAQVITSDKIERRMVANVTKALDGLASGVQTTSGSGQPGAGASVIIRGFGSLSATTTPLYVVDGVPYDGAINAINPNDIESMTIIKDASAGALYGARGANGVVMITTKKGKEGEVSVNFKTNWGFSSRSIPRYETMDAYQWTEDVYFMYKNRMISNGITPSEAGPAALQEMATGVSKIFGSNTKYNPFSRPVMDLIDHSTGKIYDGTTQMWDEDWLDYSTAENPLRQEYLMTVSGGGAKTNYMFSLGYLQEEGLVKFTDFERFSGRANIDSQVKEWFKTGFNVNLAANTTNSTTLGSSQSSSSAYSNVFYSAMKMPPIYPMYLKDENGQTVYDIDGNPEYDWGEDRPSGASAGWNPLANLEKDKYAGSTDNASGRTYMEFGGLTEGAFKGFKLALNFGFDYALSKSKTYWNPDFGNGTSLRGLSAISDGKTMSYTFNQLLFWDRRFDKHHFDMMAGHELYDYTYQYLYGEKTGFPFGGLYELNAATTIADVASYTNRYVIESYLSRFNYDFADKYYLSASYRRDGTSRFFKDVRWGDFWSLGGSWRISEEPFMDDYDWLNNLTLKASYGVQGNDAIGSLYAWQAFYDLGFPNQSLPGAAVSSLENKDLKWEKNENFNTGIEARILDRLSISAEYYSRYTRDMLMDYPMALSTGFDGYSKNIGNMKNSGFEFTLSMDVINNSRLKWNSTFMGSTVKNKVINLADKPEIISGSYIIKEGETLNSFYLAESAGVDPATGKKLYWVWDNDDNGEPGEKYISDSSTKALQSRSIAGSRIPSLYGSWSNDFNYKNFDLSIMTTYSFGGKILDGVYYGMLYNQYVGETAHVDRLKSWRKPGDIVSIPRIDVGNAFEVSRTADELINASYFAIKNITLGYSLPAKMTRSLNAQNLRVTLTADNLHIFTALRGLDPQYNFSGGTGYTYTPARTISVGLDLRF
ncbi:MAG TPA: TonB-dependent receptor [Bacteroidales bacterium]|nr:TonB-dependent receptor [Bacteroidales bacterium]